MTNKLLEFYIEKIVKNSIQEITARKGPRTGGFDFDDITIDHVFELVKKYSDVLRNDPDRDSKQIKEKVSVRSPISNQIYKIPFIFYWDTKNKATGLFMPYVKGRGKISINVAHSKEESWVRSIIAHELSHAFDMKFWKDIEDPSKEDYSEKEYFMQPREKVAFLNSFIQAMKDYAKEIVANINSGSKIDKILAKNIIARPWRLYERLGKETRFKNTLNHYLENHPDFKRKLNIAAYDIVQGFLVGAIDTTSLN